MKVTLVLLLGVTLVSADHPPPSSSYGAPPAPTYGAPAPAPTYGAPAPSPTYGAPVPAPTYGAPAPTYGPPAPVYQAFQAIPAYILPVGHHGGGGGKKGTKYKGGYGKGLFIKKGGKQYFNDYIREKFGKWRYAKDYLKFSLDNIKSKVLEWKGNLLRAKGHFLAQKGDKYIEKAYASKGKYKGVPKTKGYYANDDYYYTPEEHDEPGKGYGPPKESSSYGAPAVSTVKAVEETSSYAESPTRQGLPSDDSHDHHHHH